jgi:hypothetical protein
LCLAAVTTQPLFAEEKAWDTGDRGDSYPREVYESMLAGIQAANPEALKV